jgi:uroporphyrinogen decarboxylase
MDLSYWDETIEAWHDQRLPLEVKMPTQVEDHFGLDRGYEHHVFHPRTGLGVAARLFPPFEREVLEDEGDTLLIRDEEGVILRETKRMRTIPQHIRFPVENREEYQAFRWRLNGADPKRYPDDWDQRVQRRLESNLPVGIER